MNELNKILIKNNNWNLCKEKILVNIDKIPLLFTLGILEYYLVYGSSEYYQEVIDVAKVVCWKYGLCL